VTTSLGRLVRTASHLRPSQLAWRVVHEARLRLNGVRTPQRAWFEQGTRFAVTSPVDLRGVDAGPLRRVADLWRAGQVEYLALPRDRSDWAGPGMPKLWRYERQYHSELVALALLGAVESDEGRIREAKELVSGWVESCPQPRGDAWEPYPVARRVLSWSLAGYLSPSLGATLAAGLAAQVRFLARHLEHHLRGNHLICDAAALVAGSAAVRASGLDSIGAAAAALLAEELENQVLPDGGYAERTAQYHAIVLRDVLLAMGLSRARGIALDARIASAARRMAGWLATVARGNAVPYLNDAAPDATPSVGEVLSLARALRLIDGPWQSWLGRAFGADAPALRTESVGDVQLPDTGWTLVREGGHELLFEHGPIGPDEQPGHGHSDALSYELFWDGHPIVTDTGVTTYDIGAVRDFERSAPAHATVSVGGEGPDELWAAFRVGARASVQGSPLASTAEGVRKLEGIVRAPPGWEHRRRFVFWPGEALVVFDFVRGARDPVRSHLPLAPGCALGTDSVVRSPGGELRVEVLRGTRDDGAQSWVGEGFGRRRERMTFSFVADAEGRVAYAILAPGRSVSVDGAACHIRGPRGSVEIPGVA